MLGFREGSNIEQDSIDEVRKPAMNSRLTGKIALLTAAAQGIGRATALAYAAEGAVVWATDINQTALNEVGKQCPGIHVQVLDVRNERAMQELVNKIGVIDVLFNCIGYVHHGTILDCSEEDWDLSFDINVKSKYRTCRAVLPRMLEAGTGNIINMASGALSIKAAPNRFVYASTKAAVIGSPKRSQWTSFVREFAAMLFVRERFSLRLLNRECLFKVTLKEPRPSLLRASRQGDWDDQRKLQLLPYI